jgi:hypothetical protein
VRFNGVLSVEEEVWSSVTIRDVRAVGYKSSNIKMIHMRCWKTA